VVTYSKGASEETEATIDSIIRSLEFGKEG